MGANQSSWVPFKNGYEVKKILNICLNSPYSEGLSYQDNLLPKFQRRLGFDVIVFTSTYGFGASGVIEHIGEEDYVSSDNVRIVRMENDQRKPPTYRFKTFGRLYTDIEAISPDIIFLHGLQMRDSATIARYASNHRQVKLYVDNHADYSNSATSWLSKHVLHNVLWRYQAKLLEPLVERFWGVLPARVDFLIENYRLPRDRCDLLIMGADDDEVQRADCPTVRNATRYRLGFTEDDFVIVTGGKIDAAKRQTLDLMEAVVALRGRVKLLVFGPVAEDMKQEFEARLDEGTIAYVPWASSSESYDYFSAADLICFPGRHSVYWEQAAAMGKPMVVKDWPGTHHIDSGGSVMFLASTDSDALTRVLGGIQCDGSWLKEAGEKARSGSSRFLYSKIALRSVGER